MTYLEVAEKYAVDTISDKIPSCLFVKQASQRFLDDLKNPLYYYDNVNVSIIINFVEAFYLTETSPKKLLTLQPWQVFITCNLYGLYKHETKTKKYRLAYLELGRGNGKTQLICLFAIYELLLGIDSQIVLAANTNKQVMEVDFDKIKKLIHQIDPKEKQIKIYYNRIVYKNNKLILLSNESKPVDGLSGSFMVVDEMHEMKNLGVYNVLKSSMVKRTDNQLFVITTAGFDTTSECYKMRTYCKTVLAGEVEDDSQFGIIYTLDEKDDYTDIRNWVKPNPNLSVSVVKDVIKQEVNRSILNEAEKPSILVKHFNVWLKANTLEEWIPDSVIGNALKSIDFNEDRFRGCEIWCGIDLSSVSDLTSVSYMVQLDDKLHFFNDYYLPEDSMNSNVNKEMFKEAAASGHLRLTGGNVIDVDVIRDDIIKRHSYNPILEVAYDKWNSTGLIVDLTEAGLFCKPFSQLPGNLNRPLKEMETLLKSDVIEITYNPLTHWMFNNVILKINHMGNYSIDKSSRNKKIDGVASMVNCLGAYLYSPNYSFNVY